MDGSVRFSGLGKSLFNSLEACQQLCVGVCVCALAGATKKEVAAFANVLYITVWASVPCESSHIEDVIQFSLDLRIQENI